MPPPVDASGYPKSVTEISYASVSCDDEHVDNPLPGRQLLGVLYIGLQVVQPVRQVLAA